METQEESRPEEKVADECYALIRQLPEEVQARAVYLIRWLYLTKLDAEIQTLKDDVADMNGKLGVLSDRKELAKRGY